MSVVVPQSATAFAVAYLGRLDAAVGGLPSSNHKLMFGLRCAERAVEYVKKSSNSPDLSAHKSVITCLWMHAGGSVQLDQTERKAQNGQLYGKDVHDDDDPGSDVFANFGQLRVVTVDCIEFVDDGTSSKIISAASECYSLARNIAFDNEKAKAETLGATGDQNGGDVVTFWHGGQGVEDQGRFG
jgi:hypothetical protein